eukprot:156161_1
MDVDDAFDEETNSDWNDDSNVLIHDDTDLILRQTDNNGDATGDETLQTLVFTTTGITISNLSAHAIQQFVDNIVSEFMFLQIERIAGHRYYCTNLNCGHVRNYYNCECPTIVQNKGRLLFEREADNVHDANAIKVLSHNGNHIGYIPAIHSAILAPLMDAQVIQLVSSLRDTDAMCIEIIQAVSEPLPEVLRGLPHFIVGIHDY